MSFAQCLVRLQADGTIDPERAKRFRDQYARLNAAYSKQMGAVAAAQLAGRDTLTGLEHEAFQKRRQAMMQIESQRQIMRAAGDYLERGGRGGKPGKFAHFLGSIMEHHEAVKGSIAVSNERAGLHNTAWTMMGDFMKRYRRTLLGVVRNGDELNEVVRVLRGETSTDPNARAMAASIGETMEWLRTQYNLAGGNIAHLKDWGLPQSHDAVRVGADFAAWLDYIKPRLDPARMIDHETGQPFTSEAALDEALRFAWKNISSEGLDGQIPGQFKGDGKIANRRLDHRFMVFKNADAWLEYNDRYGSGDVFSAVAGHIDSMVRDIAAMRQLGPNPALTVKWLGDIARQDTLPTLDGGKDISAERGSKKAADRLQAQWDYYSGTMTAVPAEYRGMARFFSTIRNWNVMTKLGSSFLSAIATDPVFMGMTAHFNGLSVTHQLYDYVRLFNPADAAHRDLAEHSGLIFRDMTARAEQIARDGQGLNFHELSRRGADSLLQMSLLTPHTVAAKQSVGLGFMREWADDAGKAFDQLSQARQQSFARYGITPADWDALRAVPAYVDRGVPILRPADLARSVGDQAALTTALKYWKLIDSEMAFAVPGESLRANTLMATMFGGVPGGVQRGTIAGELLHSQGQFKTYTAALMVTHLQRALYGEGAIPRGAYGLLLPILLTFGGVLATWMYDIAGGKDPEPVDSPLLWGKGFVRGGGAGYIGDVASQAMSGDPSAKGAVTSFFAGPTMGALIDPAVNLAGGAIGKYARGQDANVSGELLRQVRNQMPFGTTWYAKLAYNRMLADQLQTLADPHYAESYRHINDRARTEGTSYYWAPGQALPARAPDLAAAMGSQQAEGPPP